MGIDRHSNNNIQNDSIRALLHLYNLYKSPPANSKDLTLLKKSVGCYNKIISFDRFDSISTGK